MTIEQELKLRQKLTEHHQWPEVYIFKFIMPKEGDNLATLLSFFNEQSEISQRDSSQGKFVSVTVKEVMLSTDAVIDRYKSIKGIDGLMSL